MEALVLDAGSIPGLVAFTACLLLLSLPSFLSIHYWTKATRANKSFKIKNMSCNCWWWFKFFCMVNCYSFKNVFHQLLGYGVWWWCNGQQSWIEFALRPGENLHKFSEYAIIFCPAPSFVCKTQGSTSAWNDVWINIKKEHNVIGKKMISFQTLLISCCLDDKMYLS